MSDQCEFVRAVTEYEAGDRNELSCSMNDILMVIRRENRRILFAENLTTGNLGCLPAYCIQPVQLPVVTGGKPLFFALSDYQGTQSGDLSFEKGAIIVGDQPLDSGDIWWFGWKGSTHGLFPVQWTRSFPIENKSSSVSPKPMECEASTFDMKYSSTKPSSPKPIDGPHGWTLYPFHTEMPSELNFEAGALVHLIRVVDSNWLEGSLENGHTGIFPKDFIHIVVNLPEVPEPLHHGEFSGDCIIEDFPPDTYAIVLLDNPLVSPEALPVVSGDTVTILKKCGDHLIEAMDDFGNVGYIRTECLEVIGSEPDEVRSLSGVGNFSRGSLESLRSSGTSIGSNFSGDSNEKRLSWQDDFRDRETPDSRRRDSSLPHIAQRGESRQYQRNDTTTPEGLSKREKVIHEIISTEKDYIAGLRPVIFELDKNDAPNGFTTSAILTNLKDVVSTADALLRDLARADGQVGECFIRNIPKLKEVYTPYCQYSDAAITLLYKYKDNIELAEYMNLKVAAIRSSTNCFDLASMLIKPVQRVLKYPLLLSELLKATESSHSDYIFVRDALKRMTELASSINELKRRKELVAKYRDHSTTSFSERLSRLSFHSVVKKSNRLGLLVSSTIGFTTLIQDPAYQAEERKFQVNKRTIKWFLRNVADFLEQLQGLMPILKSIANGFSELLKDSPSATSAPIFAKCQEDISLHLLNDLASKMNDHVVRPLEDTLKQFQGPSNLMSKRHAKLIDYENAKRKFDRLKDAQRTQAATEEVELFKRVYQALNAQLLDDLPKFNQITCQILQSRIIAFQYLRKLFSYYCATQYLPCSAAAPSTLSSKKDIAKQLSHKIASILADLKKLDYEISWPTTEAADISIVSVSKDMKQCEQQQRSESIEKRRSASAIVSGHSNDDKSVKPPSVTGRSSLQRSNTISVPCVGQFVVTENYVGKTSLDLSLRKDEVVGVIKMHDPMGSDQRWFVESNGARGFVPKTILRPQVPLPVSSTPEVKASSFPSQTFSAQSGNIFLAAFDFNPSGPHQLPLKRGDTVTLLTKHDLDGNCEWWYVQSGHGARGYVPAAYMKLLSNRSLV